MGSTLAAGAHNEPPDKNVVNVTSTRSENVSETHATTEDPNTAPMHHDIEERFSRLQIAFAVALGLVAIVAGVVSGLLLANG
jgi:hypothetical protein